MAEQSWFDSRKGQQIRLEGDQTDTAANTASYPIAYRGLYSRG
jgi:hypothetical protein